MNSIHRAISSRKLHLRRPLLLLQSHYATKTAAKTTVKPKTPNTYTITTPRFTTAPPRKVALPRPSEVPFQPKVANSVRLVGHVQTPLKSLATPDGAFFAATILTSSSSSSAHSFRIPIVFEGDLAHIASLHLKDNDFVFVAGSLRSDLHQLNASEGLTRLQVMVDTLNFVQGSSEVNKSSKDDRQEETTIDPAAGAKGDEDKSLKNQLARGKDLGAKTWRDIRLKEDNPKAGAFERKNNGELLSDDFTPKGIRKQLDSMAFDRKPLFDKKYQNCVSDPQDQKPVSDSCETSLKNDEDSTLGSWNDLVDNPKEWLDYRNQKINSLVNPKHPDFKRKDGNYPLWLNRAPLWILSKLEGMEFDVPIQKSNQVKGCRDEFWKDLVENPDKWWDNRLNKRSEKAPDFKHKDTGEALWVSSSPSWVLPKLPPSKTQQDAKIGNTDTSIA